MPNLVNSKGFYTSKEKQSKSHTLYQNFVENIHNMEHNDLWKERYTNETPVNFGTFYRETGNGKNRYFLFATNMKRTFHNLSAEFTPYQHDEKDISTVSTHGYGGIALPLKIGGHFKIYFSDKDEFSTSNENYSELSMNIDSFMETARSSDVSKTLPSPTHDEVIPDHNTMICFMEKIWGAELLEHFKQMNYKTFYVFFNPDLGNMRADLTTEEYLRKEIDESFQNQFIQQLDKGFIQFFSSYSPGNKDTNKKTLNQLPEAFYKALKDIKSISIQGIGAALNEEEKIEFIRSMDRSLNVLHWKYGNDHGRVEFKSGSNEVESLSKSSEPVLNFQTEFEIRTGQVYGGSELYSDTMKTRNHLTLEIEKEGVFAEGVFVEVGDIPLTSMPIPHYLEDSSHLIGNKKRRTFARIFPEHYESWKKESIDAKEMKEDTLFSQGSLLLKAINLVSKLYNQSRPKNILTKKIIDLLDSKRINNEKTKNAAQKGNEFELIHMNALLSSILNSECIHDDKKIKKKYNLVGQGIDHILSFSGTDIVVLIQDKLQQRIAKDKILSYVNSVKEFRDKFPKMKIYSLFINGHDKVVKTYFGLMDDLICNNTIIKQSTESDEQFKNRIKSKIEEIRVIFS